MPHLVRKIQDADPKQITCGIMRKLTDSEDFKGMNFIHVTIKDSTKRHYHKKLTEVYYVLKGSIDMDVDDKTEHLTSGSIIMIFPKTKHKAQNTSKENAEVLVACCPPWSQEDEVLVE
jgi:mannose-6-phosphate isomerase-like protein (cupin superfamily)